MNDDIERIKVFESEYITLCRKYGIFIKEAFGYLPRGNEAIIYSSFEGNDVYTPELAEIGSNEYVTDENNQWVRGCNNE